MSYQKIFILLPDVIENISHRADLLVLEADVREEALKAGDTQQLTITHGFYHEGSRLEHHISREMYHHLGNIVTKLNIAMAEKAGDLLYDFEGTILLNPYKEL